MKTKVRKHRRKTKKGRTTVKRHRRKIKKRMAFDVGQALKEGHTVQYMSPDEYLSRTTERRNKETFDDMESGEERPLSELTKLIASKDVKVRVPFVGSNPMDHEGRGRAMSSKNVPLSLIPVTVPLPKKDRTRLAEEAGLLYRPKVKTNEPWQAEFHDESRKKFTNQIIKEEFPENIFDRRGTKILQDLKKKHGLDIIK